MVEHESVVEAHLRNVLEDALVGCKVGLSRLRFDDATRILDVDLLLPPGADRALRHRVLDTLVDVELHESDEPFETNPVFTWHFKHADE